MTRIICAAAFSILVLGLSISPVCGQRDDHRFGTQGPGYWNLEDQRLKEQLRDVNPIKRGPDGRLNSGGWSPYAFNNNRTLIARREQILKPTRAERTTHAQFLKQPHVGLVRLLPYSRVVTIEELNKGKPNKVVLPGGGAFYSFTKSDHSPWRADLNLKDGNLEVAFGLNVLGALTNLGDVPIDSLTINSPGVTTLATYVPPSESKQAESEYQRFKSGFMLAGYPFQTQLPVHENTTYALRSIAYGRSDLLVAVRVVKLDSDGSVLFLWKRIDKFSTPKLKAAARK
jgi:hypothetical protein